MQRSELDLNRRQIAWLSFINAHQKIKIPSRPDLTKNSHNQTAPTINDKIMPTTMNAVQKELQTHHKQSTDAALDAYRRFKQDAADRAFLLLPLGLISGKSGRYDKSNNAQAP